jgi:hypothetical protein
VNLDDAYAASWYGPVMSDRPSFGAHIVTNTLNRELKQARVIFTLIGLANIVISLLAWNTSSDQIKQAEKLGMLVDARIPDVVRIIVYVGVGLGAVYLLCAVLVYKKPIPTTITGLVIYCGFTLVQLVVDPSAVLSIFGIGLRAAMIIALASAVRFAFLYERNRAASLPVAQALPKS